MKNFYTVFSHLEAEWSHLFDYKYHLVNISCLFKIISSEINQSGIRFYNDYHWVGVNCSNCDCSTHHWSTLFWPIQPVVQKSDTVQQLSFLSSATYKLKLSIFYLLNFHWLKGFSFNIWNCEFVKHFLDEYYQNKLMIWRTPDVTPYFKWLSATKLEAKKFIFCELALPSLFVRNLGTITLVFKQASISNYIEQIIFYVCQINWQLNLNHYLKWARAQYWYINKSHHILNNPSWAQQFLYL